MNLVMNNLPLLNLPHNEFTWHRVWRDPFIAITPRSQKNIVVSVRVPYIDKINLFEIMLKMIVNFINRLALKMLILHRSMTLPIQNDWEVPFLYYKSL